MVPWQWACHTPLHTQIWPLFLLQLPSGHLSQGALASQMRELIYTDSDLVVTPIIDNPKVQRHARLAVL